MKLKLTAPGWDNFSGQMGVNFFENGLSTADVLPFDARRISGVISCEWEDGSSPSVAQSILDNAKTAAPDASDSPAAPVGDSTTPVSNGVAWTEEELGKIADEQGIAGLREIAEPAGIKSKSVQGLIEAILTAKVAKEG